MDIVLRAVSVLTVPITLVLFFLMARRVGKEMPMKKRTYLAGMVMPLLMLLINAIFLASAFSMLCGGVSFVLFIVGILLGLAAARSSRMTYRDGLVLVKRSILPIILWAISYAFTQLLAAVAPASITGVGVAMMFLSTGVSLGMNASLFRRHQKAAA